MLLYDLDGNTLINNEIYIRRLLESILLESEHYTMVGYTRRVFSPDLAKTPFLYHSFYVIKSNDNNK